MAEQDGRRSLGLVGRLESVEDIADLVDILLCLGKINRARLYFQS